VRDKTTMPGWWARFRSQGEAWEDLMDRLTWLYASASVRMDENRGDVDKWRRLGKRAS
jgi:hypothetical protein